MFDYLPELCEQVIIQVKNIGKSNDLFILVSLAHYHCEYITQIIKWENIFQAEEKKLINSTASIFRKKHLLYQSEYLAKCMKRYSRDIESQT